MAEKTTGAIQAIDALSLCAVPVAMLLDEQELSEATAFFYSGFIGTMPHTWLVSNWHVLAGRHIESPHKALHSKGAIPNRIRLHVMKFLDGDVVQVHHQFANLYDVEGKAIWLQHRLKSDVDIGVLNLGQGLSGFAIDGINRKANQYDMKIEIGNSVFVLGYPLGFSHFITTPIWKRGTIASEPHAETPESKNRIVIDATTRTGMSGSPVIVREKTHYVSESGVIKQHVNASRFLGVYSSRPVFAKKNSSIDGLDDVRAELGYVYKSGCIEEILREGIPGPDYGHLP